MRAAAGRCRKGWVGLSPTEAGALEGPRGGELEADGLGDGVLGKGAGALPGSQGSGDGLCTAVRMGPGGLSEPAEAELPPCSPGCLSQCLSPGQSRRLSLALVLSLQAASP